MTDQWINNKNRKRFAFSTTTHTNYKSDYYLSYYIVFRAWHSVAILLLLLFYERAFQMRTNCEYSLDNWCEIKWRCCDEMWIGCLIEKVVMQMWCNFVERNFYKSSVCIRFELAPENSLLLLPQLFIHLFFCKIF